MSVIPTVLITGANSGIGYEVARHLLQNGYEVFIICRDDEKTTATVTDLSRYGSCKIAAKGGMDLNDLESVRMFAERFSSKSLNILINNAGIMGLPNLQKSKQGYEAHVAINFLSHFLLTRLLLPKLILGAETSKTPSRVINVSSDAHYWVNGPLELKSLFYGVDESYNFQQQYAASKFLNGRSVSSSCNGF